MTDARWDRFLTLGWVSLLAGALVAEPAAAQRPASSLDTLVLTLATARQLALRLSPSLAAASQDIDIARGELREARQLPNPEFELEAPGVSSSSLGPYQAILGQEIEWAGQRGLRIGASEHGLDRAGSEVRNARRELVRDVSLAWAEAVVAAARMALAGRVLALNDRLRTAVGAQLAQGKISPLDANLAEIELGRARAQVLSARRGLTEALSGLKEQIGLEPGRQVRVRLPADLTVPSGDSLATALPAGGLAAATIPPEDSLVALALRRRPDLAAGSAAVEEATSRLRLARREVIPTLVVGPMAERDEASGSASVGVAVSLSVPLWNHNGGAVAQRRATLRQATSRRSAVELAVRLEVGAARLALLSAQEEVETLRTSVVQPARENQRLLDIAYRAGKIDLPYLLLVRHELLDAETEYQEAWLARQEAWIRLQAATAGFGMEGSGTAGAGATGSGEGSS